MNNTNVKQKERILSNPLKRCEIRKDFPEVIANFKVKKLLKVIDQELIKHGTSLEKVGHITLVYPHKHPILFPDHHNSAENATIMLKKQLKRLAPQVQWITADAICETLRLNRSKNQTSLYALMTHQIYDIYKPSQKDYLPFINPPHQGKDFCVIVDRVIEQGTTISDLKNYIEHNGGFVLAASASALNGTSFAQKKGSFKKTHLSKKFNDASRNTGRLPEMAEAFSKSAKKSSFNWSPKLCMDMFNESLKKHGNSVFALTNNECSELINTVSCTINEPNCSPVSFPSILDQLNSKFVTEPSFGLEVKNSAPCASAIC